MNDLRVGIPARTTKGIISRCGNTSHHSGALGALEIPCHFFKLKKRNDTCEMILILIQLFLPCKMARS